MNNDTISTVIDGVSSCHNAGLKVAGHTTHYYVCVKCGKPCDRIKSK